MEDPGAVHCGQGVLDGMVWRAGDPVKHLGPPARLGIHSSSRLFSTRCGLSHADGWWRYGGGPGPGVSDDDEWCPRCLKQAAIPCWPVSNAE